MNLQLQGAQKGGTGTAHRVTARGAAWGRRKLGGDQQQDVNPCPNSKSERSENRAVLLWGQDEGLGVISLWPSVPEGNLKTEGESDGTV